MGAVGQREWGWVPGSLHCYTVVQLHSLKVEDEELLLLQAALQNGVCVALTTACRRWSWGQEALVQQCHPPHLNGTWSAGRRRGDVTLHGAGSRQRDSGRAELTQRSRTARGPKFLLGLERDNCVLSFLSLCPILPA